MIPTTIAAEKRLKPIATFPSSTFFARLTFGVRTAAERAGLIFAKTAYLMRHLPDETFRELGFPPETWSYIRLKTLPFLLLFFFSQKKGCPKE